MAFRKRNSVVNRNVDEDSKDPQTGVPSRPGVRPSPITAQPVTSTGTPSLDALLGGHGGLALGSSLLVEESGTTDFAGALVRYYAAEGICQGHVLHLVGVGDDWLRGLPGVADERSRTRSTASADEKMKIAWRYEKLGQAGERALPNRSVASPPSSSLQETSSLAEAPFAHTFDLTKRLSIGRDAKIHHHRMQATASPFETVLKSVEQAIAASDRSSIHRIVIPSILSPAVYHPQASRPEVLLRFVHALRALLRRHSLQLTCLMTLPLELFSRSSALVRIVEVLSDGVIELTPFPHLMDASNSLAESGGARAADEQPQGMVHVHKLPVITERGEGGAGANNSLGEDLSFTVSRRKFAIKPFSLPPLEGDQDAQKEAGKLTGKDVEF